MNDFPDRLVAWQPSMLRSARARLRNPDWAADAVSAATLAALEALQAPQPPWPGGDPARLRAWLHGVLRHKVVDQLRREIGDGTSPALVSAVGDSHDLDACQADGAALADDPLRRACATQFAAALAGALAQLPQLQARAFLLCDAWGLDTGEACAALAVTPGHLWVLRHRARQRLRRALAAHADG